MYDEDADYVELSIGSIIIIAIIVVVDYYYG
jgi:hypothetical protein